MTAGINHMRYQNVTKKLQNKVSSDIYTSVDTHTICLLSTFIEMYKCLNAHQERSKSCHQFIHMGVNTTYTLN